MPLHNSMTAGISATLLLYAVWLYGSYLQSTRTGNWPFATLFFQRHFGPATLHRLNCQMASQQQMDSCYTNTLDGSENLLSALAPFMHNYSFLPLLSLN